MEGPNPKKTEDIATNKDWLPSIYDELRRIAASKLAQERPGQTLQATALVHEAWLRLGADQQPHWGNRAHFFGSAAEAMRRILIDRARKRQVRAASGLSSPEELHESRLESPASDDEMLSVHDVLDQLAKVDAAAAALVKLRYFIGMNMKESAEALDIPLRRCERQWTFAKAWLRNALHRD